VAAALAGPAAATHRRRGRRWGRDSGPATGTAAALDPIVARGCPPAGPARRGAAVSAGCEASRHRV